VSRPADLVNLPLLDGAQNFRAVQPYPAAGGRLRARLVFRSGELSRLTPIDSQAVGNFNIRLVCDLRSSSEQAEFPTRWPAADGVAPRWLNIPDQDDSDAGPAKVFDLILSLPGDKGAAAAMNVLYRRKPRAFAASLARLFEAILQGDSLPVLIHCHAGKDRTGFVTAMLLAALGVAKMDIVDDYITTTRFMPVHRESLAIADWAKRSFNRNIDPDQAVPLVEARPEYIEAAFSQITTDWGSVDQYLTEATGLTQTAREKLQTLLLV